MRQAEGFTLLEMLVGLALFGLVITGLGAGLRHVVLVRQIQARLIDRTEGLDTVERVLRRGFGAAEPGAGEEGAMQGGPDRVSWVSVLPGLGGRRAEIALFVSADRRLLLRWQQPAGEAPRGTVPAPNEVELASGVERLEVAYWQGDWRRRWNGAELPALVKVRVGFARGDTRQWPDMVMATVIRRPH